jgi:hypothetical protein
MKAEFDGVVNTSHPFWKFHFWKFQLVETYIHEPYCIIDHLLQITSNRTLSEYQTDFYNLLPIFTDQIAPNFHYTKRGSELTRFSHPYRSLSFSCFVIARHLPQYVYSSRLSSRREGALFNY